MRAFLSFPVLLKFQEKSRALPKKNAFEIKEMSENINDTRSKTELGSVEDLLRRYRTTPNERTLASESPNTTNEENVIIAPGQEKTSALILSYEFCEQQLFYRVLPIGKLSYNTPQDIATSPAWYFNQILLNVN